MYSGLTKNQCERQAQQSYEDKQNKFSKATINFNRESCINLLGITLLQLMLRSINYDNDITKVAMKESLSCQFVLGSITNSTAE